MMTRAKLEVQSVKSTTYCDEVSLSAVCGKSPEDNSFSQATPSATFTLSITNPSVRGKFKPGQKYYVDFTETDVVQ